MDMRKWIISLVVVVVLTSVVVTVSATPKNTTAAPTLKKDDTRLATEIKLYPCDGVHGQRLSNFYGELKSETGRGIPGAKIQICGSANGGPMECFGERTTGTDGRFHADVICYDSGEAVLQFNYDGNTPKPNVYQPSSAQTSITVR